MKEYIYYWYHHMISSLEIEKIQASIENKKYFDFIELYKEYSIKAIKKGQYSEEFKTWIPMTFLPDSICVYEKDKIVDYISILDKENFEKITYAECECG